VGYVFREVVRGWVEPILLSVKQHLRAELACVNGAVGTRRKPNFELLSLLLLFVCSSFSIVVIEGFAVCA
jgi:hypothetical protein